MRRMFLRFIPVVWIAGFLTPLAAQEPDQRMYSQLTFRNMKISAASADGKDKFTCFGFAGGQLIFCTIHSDKFRWFTPWAGHDKAVSAVAFDPNLTILASACVDGTVKFWNYEEASRFAEETEKLQKKEAEKVTAPKSRKLIKAHTAGPIVMAFSPDGKRLATGGADGLVKIWDVESTTKPLFSIEAHKGGVHALAFRSDNDLATGGEDKTAKLWRISLETMVEHTLNHDSPVLGLAYSQDGKWIATGGGVAKKPGSIKVWDTSTGKEAYALEGHADAVSSVWFHPKENRLISASKDKSMRVWDLESKKELYKDVHYDGLHTVFMTTDGQVIGSFSPEEGKWWRGQPKLTK